MLEGQRRKRRRVRTGRVCRKGASLQTERDRAQILSPRGYKHRRQWKEPEAPKALHTVSTPCHEHISLHSHTAGPRGGDGVWGCKKGCKGGPTSPWVPPRSPYLSILLRLCLLRSRWQQSK